MFINLGSMDGFEPGRMIKYLCEVTDMPGSIFGRIDIKGVYSFIDIDEQNINQVLAAFKNEVFRGRKVRVDISGQVQGRSGRKESYGKPDRPSKDGKKRSKSDKKATFYERFDRKGGKEKRRGKR